MADNRKEQEREELHRTIWGIANDLRGSVDGWDFKQYVLGMLFYRYISENFANYINDGEREAGDATFDYAQLSDSDAEQARDDLIKTKGFFHPAEPAVLQRPQPRAAGRKSERDAGSGLSGDRRLRQGQRQRGEFQRSI